MGYFGSLWKALLGYESAAGGVVAPVDEAFWRARVAALELDLAEARKRADQMCKEYSSLQGEHDRALGGLVGRRK